MSDGTIIQQINVLTHNQGDNTISLNLIKQIMNTCNQSSKRNRKNHIIRNTKARQGKRTHVKKNQTIHM